MSIIASELTTVLKTVWSEKNVALAWHGIFAPLTPIATVIIPVRTVSELNRHEHWRHRQKRAKGQHEAVFLPLHCMADMPRIKIKLMTHDGGVHVHLTRLATRKLDTDNLAGSLKHVRDAVAKFLGVDDGDESKVTWSVNQEQQKGYAVRIEFYRRQP